MIFNSIFPFPVRSSIFSKVAYVTQEAVHWIPASKSFVNLIKARVWRNREITWRRAEGDASSCQNKKNTWNTTSDYDPETLMRLPWHRIGDECSKQHFLFGTISKHASRKPQLGRNRLMFFSCHVTWGMPFQPLRIPSKLCTSSVHDASISRVAPPLIYFDYLNQKLSILIDSVTICVCVCVRTRACVCVSRVMAWRMNDEM